MDVVFANQTDDPFEDHMHTMVVAIDFHTTEVLPLTKVIIPITIVEETPTLVTPAIREAMIWERS